MNIEFNGATLLALAAGCFALLWLTLQLVGAYKRRVLLSMQLRREARALQRAVAKTALIKLLTAVTDRTNTAIAIAQRKTTAPYLEVRAHTFRGVGMHEKTLAVGPYSAIVERMVAVHLSDTVVVVRAFMQGPQARVMVKVSSGNHVFRSDDKEVVVAMHKMETALCSCPAVSVATIISGDSNVTLALEELHTALATASLDPSEKAAEIVELLSGRQQQVPDTDFKWDL